MSLTADQVRIVRSTVPILQAHGNQITSSFYSTMLKEAPELNNVFNHANQINNHQAAALAGALYAYASHIDDLGVLSPALEKICHKHASLYIQPDQYQIVGEYLLRAMGDVLGAALTADIHDAWAAAYWQLANLMIGREHQLMQQAHGWTNWREFAIADKVKESDEITSFYLKPTDGKPLPDFLPGQYISVLTDVPRLHYLQSRQYSLSDAPREDYYRISVKKERGLRMDHPEAEAHPGYISNILHDEKKPGDTLEVSHPFGEFCFDPQNESDRPLVLLSAGVGLTPMVSILNTVIQAESTQPVSFIHSARSRSTRAFANHILALKSNHENISYTSILKKATDRETNRQELDHYGRLRLSALDQDAELFLGHKNALYFVCGPNRFMAEMKAGLQDLGVEGTRIRMEVFGTGAVTKAPGV